MLQVSRRQLEHLAGMEYGIRKPPRRCRQQRTVQAEGQEIQCGRRQEALYIDCGDGDEEDGVRYGGRCKKMTNNKKRNDTL